MLLSVLVEEVPLNSALKNFPKPTWQQIIPGHFLDISEQQMWCLKNSVECMPRALDFVGPQEQSTIAVVCHYMQFHGYTEGVGLFCTNLFYIQSFSGC